MLLVIMVNNNTNVVSALTVLINYNNVRMLLSVIIYNLNFTAHAHARADMWVRLYNTNKYIPVSYTHLDVYKRQHPPNCLSEYFDFCIAQCY